MAVVRPGIAFQNLVASIERAIAGAEGVTLESPAYVLDSEGERREHDILITNRSGLRTILTAVECKDKGRKIGVPDLEMFQKKCERTGIHSGVIVSSSGFTASALRAAPKMSLQCLELARVDTFPWVGVGVLIQLQRDYTTVDAGVFASTLIVPPFKVFTDNDRELSTRDFQNVVENTFKDDEAFRQMPKNEPFTVNVEWVPGDVYVVDANDDRHTVDKIVIRATLSATERSMPFELHRYSGPDGEVQVATSRIETPNLSGKIIMAKSETGLRMFWEPDKTNDVPEGSRSVD